MTTGITHNPSVAGASGATGSAGRVGGSAMAAVDRTLPGARTTPDRTRVASNSARDLDSTHREIRGA